MLSTSFQNRSSLLDFKFPPPPHAPTDVTTTTTNDNHNDEEASIDNGNVNNISITSTEYSYCALTDPLPLDGSASVSSSTVMAYTGKQRSHSAISFTDSLDIFRESAKESKNPKLQMDFALYLLDSAKKTLETPELFTEKPYDERDYDSQVQILKLQDNMYKEGIHWLKRLSLKPLGQRRQPLAEAQYLLAEAHGKGIHGLKVDHSKAFLYYTLASKQNHPEATFRIGVCYELGAGTKKDNNRAVLFYRKAAALGERHAIHKLALIMLFGKLSQSKNFKEGMTWLKIAVSSADGENPEPIHDLAQCYEREGGCPVVISDERYALELYHRAANYGFAPSQYRLGVCFEFGHLGCEKDPKQSISWYVKAAAQGFPAAELALSSWYKTGAEDHNEIMVLEQSDNLAMQWAIRAAERDYAPAFFTVGYYYEVGVGVEPNIEEALKWYNKAIKNGSKRAVVRLKEIRSRNRNGNRCRIL